MHVMSGSGSPVPEIPGTTNVNVIPPDLNHYWDWAYGGAWLPLPECPSHRHMLDPVTKTWVDGRTLTELKVEKCLKVDGLRTAKSVLPIEYDGALLDADLKAQSNISNKLLEIRENIDLGREMGTSVLFWRDADNEMHTFSDMAYFKQWLGMLAITITERGTLLYQWAWKKKALIDAATTPEEVEAVSLE